jgi:hypothetical protein
MAENRLGDGLVEGAFVQGGLGAGRRLGMVVLQRQDAAAALAAPNSARSARLSAAHEGAVRAMKIASRRS